MVAPRKIRFDAKYPIRVAAMDPGTGVFDHLVVQNDQELSQAIQRMRWLRDRGYFVMGELDV